MDLGTTLIPLISIRLTPSVDGGLSGGLGQRDIINRMQLKLNTVGVVLTHDCEVSMILNSDLSTTSFENVQSPSLCQTIKHEIGQEIFGGTPTCSSLEHQANGRQYWTKHLKHI